MEGQVSQNGPTSYIILTYPDLPFKLVYTPIYLPLNQKKIIPIIIPIHEGYMIPITQVSDLVS